MNLVCMFIGGSFVCDAHNLTFLGVKFHFVNFFPHLKSIQVFLESVGVLLCFNVSIGNLSFPISLKSSQMVRVERKCIKSGSYRNNNAEH